MLTSTQPLSDRVHPHAKSFFPFDNSPARRRLDRISRDTIDPDRLQPLLPPNPCPHNRRRSDQPRPSLDPTSAPLHLVWHTVKQALSHVLGSS